jgi:divalent metal cation (Fe/Co/Zn/Cd) transporter
LAVTGVRLVRRAAGGLLDEEDAGLIASLVAAFNEKREPGIIRMHRLRAIRAGRYAHVDAHLIVPEYWTVDAAHDALDAFEKRVIERCKIEGEIVFHSAQLISLNRSYLRRQLQNFRSGRRGATEGPHNRSSNSAKLRILTFPSDCPGES